MEAGAAEGTLTTRPVRFTGSHLFVNVADAAGALRVEVLDSAGNVIPQFAKVNCAPVAVDKTMQEVTWSSGSIASLAGQTVQFRFYLTNGALYSFWVSNSASGASNGYVAAGGPGYTSDIDTVGSAAGNTTPSGAVAAPVLSPAGGTFSGSVTVSISTATNGATIRYTTDGADPTTASPAYTGPWVVNASMTVKAKAFAAGLADSGITLGLFTIQADTTPPSRGSGAPSGTLAFATTQATLSLRTGESATCKYSTTANTAFGAMTGNFSSPDGIAQTAIVSGLANGVVYTYYVRCQDSNGNANTDDFVIAFAVASSGSFTPFYQYLEAESGTIVAPMSTAADTAASGGRYIATPVEQRGVGELHGHGAGDRQLLSLGKDPLRRRRFRLVLRFRRWRSGRCLRHRGESLVDDVAVDEGERPRLDRAGADSEPAGLHANGRPAHLHLRRPRP